MNIKDYLMDLFEGLAIAAIMVLIAILFLTL